MDNKEKSMNKLKNLVGLERITAQFEQYLAAMRLCREKGIIHRGHMAFVGNPGTGKTTVARLFADILHEEGLLSKGNIITVTPFDLVGEYIGQTSAKTRAVCDSAKGGVLFIDEAYQLMSRYGDVYKAIDELAWFMTSVEAEDAIVILSCYPDEIEHLLNSNPCLKSRMNNIFYFDDYKPDVLTEMFCLQLKEKSLRISEDGINQAKAYFTNLYFKRGKSFGNAHEVQSLFSEVKTNQARRLYEITNPTEEDLSTILPQDFPTIEHNNISREEKAIDKLKSLIGIENIREQFEKYRAAYKRYCLGEGGDTFRPHMAFMGNPGTGKTTVARLFGSILHEDGLLPQGQFVEATVGDLVGQYIGETRVKTAALCDRAKGGVLFIDEAYGLMSGANDNGHVDFGQEAIEVLIQFMENNKDSLVIVAGYPDEIKRLINEGNPGFKSRFNEKLGFFYFEDYEPDVLYKILLKNLDEHEMSDDFMANMREIIEYEYEYRNPKDWGNARTIENYANEIFQNYIVQHKALGVIDCDCIPEILLARHTEKKLDCDTKQLKEEMMLIVEDIQIRLQQLQSKLKELS